jgi:hypothetical protein
MLNNNDFVTVNNDDVVTVNDDIVTVNNNDDKTANAIIPKITEKQKKLFNIVIEILVFLLQKHIQDLQFV